MILSLNKYDESTKISGTNTILYDIDGDVAYFGEGQANGPSLMWTWAEKAVEGALLSHALALAGDLNAALPGTGLVHQLYRSVEADGKRNEGIQALARALEKLAGVEIRE